jgi:integrase
VGYVTERNGRRQATYRGPDGKERTKTFDRVEDADRWLSTEQGDVARGHWIDPRSASITLAAFVDKEYRPTMIGLAPTTAERDESHLRTHILPTFGAIKLRDITYPMCQAWVNELASRRAPATVVKSSQILGKVLKTAVRARRMASNPMDGVGLPKVEESEDVYLTPAQVRDLGDAMEEVEPRCRALVFDGCYAGPRIGELIALRWSDLSEPRRTLSITKSFAEVKGRGMIEGPTKTKAGRRQVTLPRLIFAELERHRKRFPSPALIFTSPDGAIVRPRNLRRRAWEQAVALAELDPAPTFHDMRHTAVSLWIAAGASDLEVSRWAGHRSVSFTKDRYAHLFPEHGEALADRLDAFIESATNRPAAKVAKLR